jgi:hypothetical protein
MALVVIKNLVLNEQGPFRLAVSLRQTKNFFLRVPCVSAVKTLFWTSMVFQVILSTGQRYWRNLWQLRSSLPSEKIIYPRKYDPSFENRRAAVRSSAWLKAAPSCLPLSAERKVPADIKRSICYYKKIYLHK